MSDLAGRKVFKVFNQEFVVDERYNVTKELGQGAYGIVWYAQVPRLRCMLTFPQRGHQQPDGRRRRDQESHQCFQQEDPGQARSA